MSIVALLTAYSIHSLCAKLPSYTALYQARR